MLSSDKDLLDGSSYEYKLSHDMLTSPSSSAPPSALKHITQSSISPFTPRSHSHSDHHSHPDSGPSRECPRIPHFLNSPAPTVSFVLRQKQYEISNDHKDERDLSVADLTSSMFEYKKEIEHHEEKKREEMINGQLALLEVYRNKIASNVLAIEEVKQEYEQKLYQQKLELNEKHQAELEMLRQEERDRQFADRARIEAIKDKLKTKYEMKISAFQKDIEDTRTALSNKKLQIQGSVEHANREITTLKLQQESTERLHQKEIAQKDEHVQELQGVIKDYQTTKLKNEELIRSGVEIAALVIHMHEKGRPLSTEDLDVAEMYKYLNLESSGSLDQRKDSDISLQSIVPTKYLQKAFQSSKVIFVTFLCRILCFIILFCVDFNSINAIEEVGALSASYLF